MYKCPLCSYRAISLIALKMHVAKKHDTDICPICYRKYRNIIGHFYIYARTHNDSHHLLLYFLFRRDRYDSETKQKIEKLLSV